MSLTIKTIIGPEAPAYGEALARLRISVFREYPYLYEGTMEYERRYIQRYLECPECLFVLVFDGDAVVGVSTAIPMEHECDEFKTPFSQQGYDVNDVFYFGESVLMPQYRGQGIGHRFFDERERYARSLGRFNLMTFCAVERPADHRLRPANYRPHDAFWGKRGYVKQPALKTSFDWKDIDQPMETLHTLTFWTRAMQD